MSDPITEAAAMLAAHPDPMVRLIAERLAGARVRRRAAGLSRDDVARRIGLSRPQLANAEAQQFGLSQTAAARLLAEIARLRPRQIRFDLPLLATVRYARRRPRAEEARHAAD